MSTRAQFDFSGKVVVVTGGSRGIGEVVARRFLGCKAAVSIWDLNAPSIAADAKLQAIGVDITDLTAVQRAVESTVNRFGRIDMLAHCAGLAGETVPMDQTSPGTWRRIIDVNLIGTYHVCRSVITGMRAAGAGRIVNLASLAGKEGTPNASAYSAAKAGVLALTKSLGKELAGSGVLVNAIAPAAIDTPLLEQMSASHVETMISKSPLKRLGTPDEVAEMVLWLASDSCTFNTGAVFDLSGGRATH
jgi:3-oxoacyl-[acyl-carrier protein] reductase